MKLISPAIAACVLLTSGSAWAADRLVPSQYATIQAAIDAAANGDVVQISPGNYAGPIDTKGKAITVRGTSTASATVVSGGAGVLQCVAQEGPGTLVENLTITGGSASMGAGVRIDGASPTIRNCRVLSNSWTVTGDGGGEAYGAGIYIRGGAASIETCLIAGNSLAYQAGPWGYGSVRGAGLYLESTSARVSDCTISGNIISTGTERGAGYGAGVCVFGAGNPTLLRCRFATNTLNLATPTYGGCSGSGLALYFQAGAPAVLDGCEFTQHSNTGCGGTGIPVVRMESNPNQIFISNCLFCGNTSAAIQGAYIDLGNNRFPSICPSCTGDLNSDGRVDGADLGILLSRWGPCSN